MEKVITLSGKFDSSNASEEENRIFSELDSYDGDIIIDVEKLQYISSAGLRVILGIKKKYPNTKIVNCNSDVYEIFEVTGFTQMIDIKKRIKTISVEGCKIIDEGAYGIIYRIDPDTIVKVYKNSTLEDIIREKENAKKAFILGIPTAISYDIVKVGNMYGAVFEMLEAKTFAVLLREGENLDILAKESVKILKQIHETENINNDLPNKKDEVTSWAYFCKDYLPEKIGTKLIKMIEDIPDRNTIIHGDFHIKNIMHLKNETLLIDMETISIGHPIFEFACSFSVYQGFECLDPKNPEKFLGIPRKQCRDFFKLTLKYYFDNISEQELEDIKKMIEILCYTRLLRRQIKHFGLNNKDAKASIDYCKNFLIINVPTVNKLYF